MHPASLVCSSNSPSQILHSSPRFTPLFPIRFSPATPISSTHPPLNNFSTYPRVQTPIRTSATQEVVETSKSESEFIEIGYISNAHGLQGEIRVRPNTGFPELRFSEPGKRWLRQPVLGKPKIQEVELVEGRDHPGQKSWILRFSGIETVDQAKLLVGSTLLVRDDDRPELEEDEFYTRDLVGMRVLLKESGEPVGTVVNVFDSGASDLLQVMLDSPVNPPNGKEVPKSTTTGVDGPLVWVPFVEAIVPVVDMTQREMHITPPKGLLELNVRSDDRSKKERRQLEWKQRKKFQQRLIAAKKKLSEMNQKHVFDGFRHGEKSQGRLLADEIVAVNSKLLQQALQNIEIPSKRWNLCDFISTNPATSRSTLRVSEESLAPSGVKDILHPNFEIQQKGLILTSKGKVAVVLVVNDNGKWQSSSDPHLGDSDTVEYSSCQMIQKLLGDDQRFVKVEGRASVPLVIVSPSNEISSLEELFSNNDYFGFDSEKVWFLEEATLPVVSSSIEVGRRKILMKSPWEILQSPVGSGGVVTVLSSNNILDHFTEMGLEYIEVLGIDERCIATHSLLLGFVDSRKSETGIQITKHNNDFEENCMMIFSLEFMKKLSKQIEKLHFQAIAKPSSHVEKVDKEWVDIVPSSPNSYELRSSIFSSLNALSSDKVCFMEIIE